jgi:phosphoribosylamine--glycine ligase
MLDAEGNVGTLEFNCRMGDPETQPIMLRLKSDLFELFELACAGTLDQAEIEWDRRTALGVVLAAANYPTRRRRALSSPDCQKHRDRTEDCMVFHSGTALEGDKVLVNGGRVLCVTALGDSIKMAQRRAYQVVEGIHFDGMQYRRDIGHRAIPVKKQ